VVNALPAGALRCEWAGEGEPVEVRVRATDPPCTDDLRVGIILEEWRVGAPVLIPPTSFSSDPEALGQLIDDVEDRRGPCKPRRHDRCRRDDPDSRHRRLNSEPRKDNKCLSV